MPCVSHFTVRFITFDIRFKVLLHYILQTKLLKKMHCENYFFNYPHVYGKIVDIADI